MGAPPVRLFTRQATGLRREVSPRSSLIFNTFTAPTPFILAVAVFWILGVFPGANLYIALAGGYAAGMVICFAISTVTTAIPRTGGDYVFVGRILHPLVGIVSSFLYSAATLLSGAAIAYWAVTVALAPSLQVIGLISHGKTLLNWGTTLSTSHGWQFGIAAAFMLAAAVLAGVGWKWALRVQAVGFLLGTLGLIVAALVVLLDGGSTFVSSFNHFAAPITHQSDTYHQVIASGRKAGINLNPGSDFANTWPAFGAVMGFAIFSFYSTFIAGEVQQVRSWKTAGVMIGATLFNGVTCLVMTWIFFYGFGGHFFTAINAISGTHAYPFIAPPFYVFLASIASGSSIIAWFLGISIVATFFVLLWLQFVQPMRALFAYAFDGVLPLRIAYVWSRVRVPVVALAISLVIMLALLVWAVYGGNFFVVYATGVLAVSTSLILMSLSVIVFARRRPELWRGSVANGRIGRVPITTVAGCASMVLVIILAFLYLRYTGLGITNVGAGLRNVGLIIVAAIVVFGVSSLVRARQGIRLSQTTSEIPPE